MDRIKEKKVELIELFYDLIYVYAISRLTMLIEEPSGGIIGAAQFGRYLIISFVILQAWLYLTNYVNRYGTWRWYEYALTAVNMTAAVYMANTISTDWEDMYIPFNIAMLVMLLCVAVLYFIQTRIKTQDTGAAENSLTILGIVCAIYVFAIVLTMLGVQGSIIIWLDVVAVLVGAFIPFVIRGKFDISIISFPHLTERFELLTIITFGEGVVGMTSFFDVMHFSLEPIMVFSVLLSLYGSYVVQIHYLVGHMRVERALRLMFSHYFIVITVNLITVALKLMTDTAINALFLVLVMSGALVVFYIALISNRAYYKEQFSFTKADAAKMSILTVAGVVVMLIFRGNSYGFLCGSLIVTVGNFVVLCSKYIKDGRLPDGSVTVDTLKN